MTQTEANNFLNNLNQTYPDWAERWCQSVSHACGCMGCADGPGGAVDAGITEEQWKYWIDNIREI